MRDVIAALLRTVLGSKTLEEAAQAVLRQALMIAEQAIETSRFTPRGRMLRGMVHLRPDDGYRGLVILEAGAQQAFPVGGTLDTEPSCGPSATAWRWVAEHGAGVAIDVSLGRVEPDGGQAAAVTTGASGLEGAFGRESAERLLDRSTTHLYALPLRAPGRLLGMLSLEAECHAAIGRPFVWERCRDELQLLADVAAPHLSTHPRASSEPEPTDELLPVVGAAMAGLVKLGRVFARQEETVLISGPTGAGKSRLARWCHARSKRHALPFEVLDLTAIPDELQLAELFGWKKGAFTGAVSDNPGGIARAERGTLFLDEIDKLSLKAQAGLLRVLEERRYKAIGDGAGDRVADVRFLIGTNARLDEAVRAGRFREDLYYRINVLPLRLPPLDERVDEIPRWADYMATRRHREESSGGRAWLSEAAASVLLGRRWPGNLRQLDNVIRRAHVLSLMEHEEAPRDLVIEARHLELSLGTESSGEAGAFLSLLGAAARAFVDEAERRGAEGLPLDLSEAFPGLVLAWAARKAGGMEAAFRLLGKGAVVEHRNHRKVLRRELEKVAELYRQLGRAGEFPFSDLLGEEKR